MCKNCVQSGASNVGDPVWDDDRDPLERVVPHWSGEAAIYTPEYLERKEGNRLGTEGHHWWFFVPTS